MTTREEVAAAYAKRNRIEDEIRALEKRVSELKTELWKAGDIAQRLEDEFTDEIRGLKYGTTREAREYRPAMGNTD